MPNQRNVVEFPPNIPVEVSLKYPTAKLINTTNGDRALFSLTDGRAMFLDPEVAKQIDAAQVNVKEPFTITRRQNGKAKSSWEIAKITPQAGEQKNGTFVLPRDPEAPAPKPIARAAHVSSIPLAEDAKNAVDAFAEVLAYGLAKYQGKVKPDEIQRIFATVYIQRKGAA